MLIEKTGKSKKKIKIYTMQITTFILVYYFSILIFKNYLKVHIALWSLFPPS